MAWQLSDNGLKAVTEIGRWVMAAIAVAAMWVQSSNQHAERIAELRKANQTNERLAKAMEERKPLVFGKDQ